MIEAREQLLSGKTEPQQEQMKSGARICDHGGGLDAALSIDDSCEVTDGDLCANGDIEDGTVATR